MLTLQEIRHRLEDRKVKSVADATGLHYNTVRDIRDRDDANPTYRAVYALSRYFEERDNGVA